MSDLVSGETVSETWLLSLEKCLAAGGRLVHLIATVRNPGLEIVSIRDVVDEVLDQTGHQSINTVAETIFPSSLYPDPGVTWRPKAPKSEKLLDAAANHLYSNYMAMLPILLTANGNHSGTYFSRMISWPGKTSNGLNQLDLRIKHLRGEHRAGRRTNNTLDIDVAADAIEPTGFAGGLQVYGATDRRARGFPCLTHIDLTLYRGRLHAVALYRHQYFIDKAYGNFVGLSRLMHFLCQQTGFELGELVVHATMADAQRPTFGSSIPVLLRKAREVLEGSALTEEGS